MAATPPGQIIGSPRTPPTPLHGAAYDHEDSPRRISARLRQKRILEDVASQTTSRPTRSAETPNSPKRAYLESRSPDQTPQRKPSTRRVQVMSPTSPDSDTSTVNPSNSRMANHQQYLSANTTLGEGMLPTPVKTPNKRQKMISKSNIAARALFQDQLTTQEMAPSPRKNRKNKRFNGFSLESFGAEDGGSNGIQIFTDSRDQIPKVDREDDNPFVDIDEPVAISKKVSGTTKRRKISESKRLDPQVEEALRNDDGIVYVFRGKKVYRRFDDDGEDEEEIDPEDLGLLEYMSGEGRLMQPMKTLTRKSIRPTRLFQTEEQKRARELEKEEEVATDIEEALQAQSDAKVEGQHIQQQNSDSIKSNKGKSKLNKFESSRTSKINTKDNQKGSPFDAWPRVKPGSASSAGSQTKRGRKRAASQSPDELLTADASI